MCDGRQKVLTPTEGEKKSKETDGRGKPEVPVFRNRIHLVSFCFRHFTRIYAFMDCRGWCENACMRSVLHRSGRQSQSQFRLKNKCDRNELTAAAATASS